MHFLVISTPAAASPSAARGGQKKWWEWVNGLAAQGVAKHIYTKLGRGAVIIFEVESHAALHKIINQWSEMVPATFEVEPLLPKEHQERIAMAGTNPMDL